MAKRVKLSRPMRRALLSIEAGEKVDATDRVLLQLRERGLVDLACRITPTGAKALAVFPKVEPAEEEPVDA